MRETSEFQERIGRIEGLIQKLESVADPALRSSARELISALMEMQGAGLERILEIVAASGEAGAEIMASMGADPLVGSLLVLHNLHPLDFETRVRQALEKLRPVLRSQDAHAEAIAVTGGTVRLKLVGGGTAALEPAVREALLEAAPDAAEVIIEGGKPAGHAPGFVPVTSLLTASGTPATAADTVRQ